jgi:hypothetical protein
VKCRALSLKRSFESRFVETYTGTFTQSANPVISHAGLTAGSSQSSVATGAQFGAYATNVAQPVISHVGYTAGQDFSRNQYAGQQAIGQFGTSSFTQSARAVTPFNPVLQATNAAASQGPVVFYLFRRVEFRSKKPNFLELRRLRT